MQTRVDLVSSSLEIIRAGQAANGAFVASPRFPVYRYCWFRDSTFIAQALDLWGEHEPAHRFYDWAVRTVLDNADDARAALAYRGESPGPQEEAPPRYLHTRYALDGAAGVDDWPNFQLDGFGSFLWGIVEHLRLTKTDDLDPSWQQAIDLLVSYLSGLWRVPSYDCWEEFPDEIHVSTLSAVSGGLAAVGSHLHDPQAATAASEIRSFILDSKADGGYLPKFVGSNAVDAGLLWACVPFATLASDHPVMMRTIEKIQTDLLDGDGGVHRYADDSYYGGGKWILLSALLAEYRLRRGDVKRAMHVAHWIEDQASVQGELPEQVPQELNVPSMYEPWVERWGPIASPLLWSHAGYLRLKHYLSCEP
jgi:GH15 family glucan-1,4-alpha-glucosidase